jgi:hypothetical protein
MRRKNLTAACLGAEIFWDKQNLIPQGHMRAIKEALKTKEPLIKKTIKFLQKNNDCFVTFALKLNIKVNWNYDVTIYVGNEECLFTRLVVCARLPGKGSVDVGYVNIYQLFVHTAVPSELLINDRF